MNPNISRTGMSRARWKYLKALKPAAPRYMHVSAHVGMHLNPLGRTLPMVPWTQRPGTTFNVGRNKAKRDKRAAAKAERARRRP